MYFRYFVNSSLGKRWGPSFEQIWFPLAQECSVPSLVEVGLVVLEKKMQMWKVYDNDGQKITWAFGSGELKDPQT